MNDTPAWQPTSESELRSLIASDEAAMEPATLKFWRWVQVNPTKWSLHPVGDECGFWVVAVLGQRCIWFNDIEGGFNLSRFKEFGDIGEEFCNQDDLDLCVRRLLATH